MDSSSAIFNREGRKGREGKGRGIELWIGFSHLCDLCDLERSGRFNKSLISLAGALDVGSGSMKQWRHRYAKADAGSARHRARTLNSSLLQLCFLRFLMFKFLRLRVFYRR
jgi:hypothetical protein